MIKEGLIIKKKPLAALAYRAVKHFGNVCSGILNSLSVKENVIAFQFNWARVDKHQ